ncbi:MAG TPA: winged helix-turn-helix transcriptional regulator [Nitrososphaeraceae archaeon]|nr:winged helix-turn-helix transcriptional regulator [Nitrososphaeraceae archaeon]
MKLVEEKEGISFNYSIFDETEEIFSSLANSQRLAILYIISNNNKKTLSSIAKELKITTQETHRNLNKLMNSNIIQKDFKGYFSLTVFGDIIIKNISAINFLSKHKRFFSEHDFHNIPIKFIQRIGALEKSEFISGFVAIIEYIKRMYQNCEKYIYSILPQVPLDLIHTAIPIVRERGLKFKHILPIDALIPKISEEFLKNEGYSQLLHTGIIERRMISKTNLGIVLTEKQALVMFPLSKGNVDMNFIFCNNVSMDDGLFHEWCLDYFIEIWNNAKTFDVSKLKKV